VTTEEIDQRIEQTLADVIWEVRGFRNWLELNANIFQPHTGHRWQDVVATAFCYGLGRSDIKPGHVKLRQVLEDTQGVAFRPGKRKEVDIIEVGNEIIVFEVKSAADFDDIDDLDDKVTWAQDLHPNRDVKGVLANWGADTDQRRWCKERGLKMIP